MMIEAEKKSYEKTEGSIKKRDVPLPRTRPKQPEKWLPSQDAVKTNQAFTSKHERNEPAEVEVDVPCPLSGLDGSTKRVHSSV